MSVFLKPSGYTGTVPRGGEPGSNGLIMDPQGRLVLCQHGDRRVARLEADRSFKTLADRYMGKRFNSPNDGVFKSNGDLYFTDPPYGLLKQNDDPAKELDFNGVYRISASDGSVTLLTKEMTFPNGIAFVARREDPLRRQLRSQESDLDGLPGEGRRHAGRGPGVRRRDLVGRLEEGPSRRHESGPGGQPVRHRPRRRVDLRRRTGHTWAPSPPARPRPTAAGARTARSSTSPPTCTWAHQADDEGKGVLNGFFV